MAVFVQSVLEQPLIAFHIATLLDHHDIIQFACVSKDARFQEAIQELVEGARFVLDMRVFFVKWDNADEEFSETLNHVTDLTTYDALLSERETYFTDRCAELCVFLRKNWTVVDTSPAFKRSIRLKMIEMREMFPGFCSHCDAFIGEVFPQEG